MLAWWRDGVVALDASVADVTTPRQPRRRCRRSVYGVADALVDRW